MDNSYTDFIAQLRNVTVDKSAGGVGVRSWTWQTCSQFGYYQSCDAGSDCPFSTLMTLDSNYQICVDGFDMRVDQVRRNRVRAVAASAAGTAPALFLETADRMQRLEGVGLTAEVTDDYQRRGLPAPLPLPTSAPPAQAVNVDRINFTNDYLGGKTLALPGAFEAHGGVL